MCGLWFDENKKHFGLFWAIAVFLVSSLARHAVRVESAPGVVGGDSYQQQPPIERHAEESAEPRHVDRGHVSHPISPPADTLHCT